MEVYVNIGLSFWDFLITIIMIWAIYRGYVKGAIVHAVTLLVILAGIAISARVAYTVFDMTQTQFRVPLYNMPVVIFGTLFTFTVFLAHFVGNKVIANLGKTALGIKNRLLGILINVIKYLFMLSIALIMIFKIDANHEFISQTEKERTKFFFPVMNIAPSIFKSLRFPEVNPIPHSKPTYLEPSNDQDLDID